MRVASWEYTQAMSETTKLEDTQTMSIVEEQLTLNWLFQVCMTGASVPHCIAMRQSCIPFSHGDTCPCIVATVTTFVFLGSSLRLTMSFAASTTILGFDCPPFILPLFLLPPSPQPPSWPVKAPRCPRMTRRLLSPARSAGGTLRRIAKPSGSTSGTASSS